VSDLAEALHHLLLRRAETVATAESLTGGMVGAALTGTPGASATFRGGLIVYGTDLKAALAGVPRELLEARGPVDADVAAALAVGVRARLTSTWGLSLTGVAGPEPQDGRPVGTLHVGVASPDGPPETRSVRLVGDRAQIRAEAVEIALGFLRDTLASREYRG
jgi:nicotinamide-nucleotide amidase